MPSYGLFPTNLTILCYVMQECVLTAGFFVYYRLVVFKL